jgi:predicted dehydrogenase
LAFTVGILGMGRISSGFDRPDGPGVQTHLKAILREPRLQVVGVADRDADRAQTEISRFGVAAQVVSPQDLLRRSLDVLCIASPDGTHLDYLRAIEGTVRVALCEKPLEGRASERLATLADLERRGSTLVVNHLRRWIPDLREWMAEARAGEFGRALSGTVHYTRGLRHNGIHAFDLLAGFIGTDVAEVDPIGEGIADREADDLTRSLLITVRTSEGSVPIALHGVDGRVQTVFALDIRFEKARVSVYDDAGIRAELHRPCKLPLEQFAPELRAATVFHDDPPRLMAAVWRNIADHLQHGTPLACAGRAALAGYDLVDAVERRLAA